ncbi:hypothetical protein L1887_55633 [Cichorium endivia]|nr:hypothetical protein L1887_55633 [Cichorium endivia]
MRSAATVGGRKRFRSAAPGATGAESSEAKMKFLPPRQDGLSSGIGRASKVKRRIQLPDQGQPAGQPASSTFSGTRPAKTTKGDALPDKTLSTAPACKYGQNFRAHCRWARKGGSREGGPRGEKGDGPR